MATINLGKIGIVNKGDWAAGTYKYLETVNHTVDVDGQTLNAVYQCVVTNTTEEPPHTDWKLYVRNGKDGSGTMSNLVDDATPQLGGDLDMNSHKINDIKLSGTISEQVGVMTTEISATLGTIQTLTMTADTTFTDALLDGQSITLLLANGGFTPTYPTIIWVGLSEPTLSTKDIIIFFKIGSILYGSHTGKVE